MFASRFHVRRTVILPCVLMWMGAGCIGPSGQIRDAGAPRDRRAVLKLDAILPLPQFAPSQATAPDDPELSHEGLGQLREARRLFDRQRWTEAGEVLEGVFEAEAPPPDARLLLARVYLRTGRQDLARRQVEAFLSRCPRDVSALQLFGEIAWREDRTAEAIHFLRLALMASEETPRRPERVLSHLSLAMALRKEGYLGAASDQLELYLAAVAEPTPAMEQYQELAESITLYRGRAASLLGEIQAELGNDAEAARAYRRAVADRPDDVSLLSRLALSLARAGQGEDALGVVREFLNMAPSDGESNPAISSDGLKLLREVCDLIASPHRYDAELVRLAREVNDPDRRLAWVQLLLQRGKLDTAIEVLSEAVAEDPPDVKACYLLAGLYLPPSPARGEGAASRDRTSTRRASDVGRQTSRALIVIARALRAEPPSYERARALLAECFAEHPAAQTGADVVARRGRSDLVEAARRLCEEQSSDPVVKFVYGLTLWEGGDRRRAAEAFEAAGRLQAGFGPPFVLLAEWSIGRKRWLDAISAADAAIATGIRDAGTYLLKGRAHDALEEYEEAEAALLEAFGQDRSSPQALYLLAESAERRGQRSRCEQLYHRILDEVDERHAPAREQLVRLHLNEGRIDRAVEYLAGFARLDQAGPAAARCRAYLNFRASRGEDRLVDYRKALQKAIADFPGEARTHVDLAMTYLASGDHAQALDEVHRSLEADPHGLRGRELEATVLARLLQFKSAAEVFRGLLGDRPRSARYQQGLLELALNEGDFASAEMILRELSVREDLADRHDLYTRELVEVLSAAGHLEEAVRVARAWMEDSPYEVSRRSVYLSAMQRAGHGDEAIDEASAWLEEDPAEMDARLRLIDQLSRGGRHTEAQQHLLSWLDEDPDNIHLNEALMRSCWLGKQWDSAIELAQAGAEQQDYRDRYEDMLGKAYMRAERFDEAVTMYQDRIDVLESHRRRASSTGNILGQRLYYEAIKGGYRYLIRAFVAAERFVDAEQVVSKLLLAQLERRNAGEDYDDALVLDLRRQLSSIYQFTDRPMQAVQQLEEMHKTDPTDAGTNNDLGYTWADEGIHLERAERMIRFAVGEAPRQAAYLDSLGWVLYKRGRADEAVKYLRRAILHAGEADPVMRDHLGDALYRTGQTEAARAQWEQALEALDSDDLTMLPTIAGRLAGRVRAKLAKLEAGGTVGTAEVVGPDTPPSAPAGEPSPEGGVDVPG